MPHGKTGKKKKVKGDDVEFIWKVKGIAGIFTSSDFTTVLIFMIAFKHVYVCVLQIRSDQIRSVAQLCRTLFDPMNCSTPGLSDNLNGKEYHVGLAL